MAIKYYPCTCCTVIASVEYASKEEFISKEEIMRQTWRMKYSAVKDCMLYTCPCCSAASFTKEAHMRRAVVFKNRV